MQFLSVFPDVAIANFCCKSADISKKSMDMSDGFIYFLDHL